LHLIDSAGEHISAHPLPKIYEATHGICFTCGLEWMEQLMETEKAQALLARLKEQIEIPSFFA
jgi:hypothetical protein